MICNSISLNAWLRNEIMRILSIFLKGPSRVLLLRDDSNALRLVCLLTDDHISVIIGILILKSRTQVHVSTHGTRMTHCEILHVNKCHYKLSTHYF